jgi:Cu/Zn superoxide dismutase
MGTTRKSVMTAVVALVAVAAGTVGVAVAAEKVRANDWLTDLRGAADGTEEARAHVVAAADGEGSTDVSLQLEGLDHLRVGHTYGAHVHIGTCEEGNGAAALGHYNHGGAASPTTEVWLDFEVQEGGVARSSTTVPFVIAQGAAHSVVVHEQATNPGTGAAGARVACIPVEF